MKRKKLKRKIKEDNEIVWEFRKIGLKFRDWVYYIRNYKENVENEQISEYTILAKNKQIEELKEEIDSLRLYNKVKDNLIEKRDEKIVELKLKINELSTRGRRKKNAK